ncbi:tsc22 domain family protein 1 [Holotrichia oblita]|uniref:Tsc22 domain family protein 1 n=1 Tax=Holotrichia oblita TaxID=644536 RepID=A0ACB9TQ47_HOLOL|nr:tsc22 domain family protein 1 [Holotrichia oblita]
MDYVDQTAQQLRPRDKKYSINWNDAAICILKVCLSSKYNRCWCKGNYGNQSYYNVPSQMLPPNQFFYSTQPISNIPTQNLQQQIGVTLVVMYNLQCSSLLLQPYIQQSVPNSVGGFTVQAYPNVQYVPSNLSQNQGSAFIPTSQNVNAGQISSNFQQSQSYAGQPTVSQPNIVQTDSERHAFPSKTIKSRQYYRLNCENRYFKFATDKYTESSPQNMVIPTNPPQQIQAVPVQTIVPNQQYNQQMQNTNYQTIQAQMNQGNHQYNRI